MRGRNDPNSGKRPYLRPGVWKVYDDLSGFPCGSDQMKFTWDGFLCDERNTWYPRQPQDFPLYTRGVTSVINSRPFNNYTVANANNYHVAGTNDYNFLTFQNGSLIEFIYYPDEYIGEIE